MYLYVVHETGRFLSPINIGKETNSHVYTDFIGVIYSQPYGIEKNDQIR